MTRTPRRRKNCWEKQRCGREPGGNRVSEHGVCPAAVASEHNGVNHGANAGRYCWRVAGTLCTGKVQGTFAEKVCDCGQCPFFLQVVREEGTNFTP